MRNFDLRKAAKEAGCTEKTISFLIQFQDDLLNSVEAIAKREAGYLYDERETSYKQYRERRRQRTTAEFLKYASLAALFAVGVFFGKVFF